MAYERLEPWGALRDDWRAGVQVATLANVNRDPKTRRTPFEPADFFSTLGRSKPKRQSPEEMMAILKRCGTKR